MLALLNALSESKAPTDRPPSPSREFLERNAQPAAYVPISATGPAMFPGWIPDPTAYSPSPPFQAPSPLPHGLPLANPTPPMPTTANEHNNRGNGGFSQQHVGPGNVGFKNDSPHAQHVARDPDRTPAQFQGLSTPSSLPPPQTYPRDAGSFRRHHGPSEMVTCTGRNQLRSPLPHPSRTPPDWAHTSQGPSTGPNTGQYVINFEEGALEEGMAKGLPQDQSRSSVYIAQGFGCYVKAGRECFMPLRTYVPFIAIEFWGGFVVYNTANGEPASELVARQWLVWIHSMMVTSQLDRAFRDFTNRTDTYTTHQRHRTGLEAYATYRPPTHPRPRRSGVEDPRRA
jgi:hypothetical protein